MITYGVKVGEPVIFSEEDRIFIAERLVEAGERYGISIITFNVLPDHVHLIVSAENEKELGEKIRKMKGFSSFEFQTSHNWEKGQTVWAQKFNRQAINEESDLINIIEYIENNHLKHSEIWGQKIIETWNNGLPDKGLKPIAQIVRDSCQIQQEIFRQGA